jgi:D-alanyl-D-alanine dipeptidase
MKQQRWCESWMRPAAKVLGAIGLIIVLQACGGGGGGAAATTSNPSATSTAPIVTETYAVGGSVSGLASGQTVTVANVSGLSASFSANGTYTFVANVPGGANYSLSISAQPVGQTCSISNASGTIAGAGVSNVTVNCVNILYTVGGTVSGLANGQNVTVADASGVSARFSANGAYTFVANVSSGATFNLSVTAQPVGQICSISNASGTIIGAGVSSVSVNCINNFLNLLAGNVGGSGVADGTGTVARFRNPQGIATDAVGNVYVSDVSNHTIRKISPAGEVITLAGSAGRPGSADGAGTAARFFLPAGLATDAAGNVFVADEFNHTIRKITPQGMVSTLAGRAGSRGSADGTGTAAYFNNPRGLATDAAGNVYVADYNNHTIRKVTPAGAVSTFAGSAGNNDSVDGIGTVARFYNPNGLTTDAAGNVYVADSNNHTVRKISPASAVSTLAGSAGNAGSADGAGSAARFLGLDGIVTDVVGNVYIADTSNHTIRKITPAGAVSTLAGSAGNTGSVDGTGTAARFFFPRGLATDIAGNTYVTDSFNHTIRKITSAGAVSTLAGSAVSPGSVDGMGTVARFSNPQGLATDAAGNVYVADTNNSTIRKISTAGVVSTLAGNSAVFAFVNGTGTVANFFRPQGLATDAAGNVYVADTNNSTIRKISPARIVSTLAGSADFSGSADGTGTTARFLLPQSLATDAAGNVYVADSFNHTIRKISAAGVVSTLAGSAGIFGSVNGIGTAARFSTPQGLATDDAGNVFVADTDNSTIRKISPAGQVSILAGSEGRPGSADGTGVAASFNGPRGLATDAAGNVYVADFGNHTIRKINPAGVVTTVVGRAGSDGVSLTQLPAGLNNPVGLAISDGKLFIAMVHGVVWTYLP